MAEAKPDPAVTTAQVAKALRRHRQPLAVGLGLCVATLIAGLAIPVGLPDGGTSDARGRLGTATVEVAPEEDLSAFASSRRWGGSTFEEVEAQRRAALAGEDTAAGRRDRMGFVGTTATADDRVALLTLPGGGVARIPAGGTLPDGRTVSDVTATTATLSDSGRGDEALELFPRPPAASAQTVESVPEVQESQESRE